MTNTNTLIAELREGSGKGPARALRREGKIPAIIYGGNKEEVKVSTPLKELNIAYHTGGFTAKVFEIDLGKEKVKVIPRDVQVHPVTDVPLHADFQRVDNDTIINVFVHIRFLNAETSPGLKRGGVLSIIRRDVELVCRADSIPSILEVDLAGVKIGESIHSHSITLPEGVEFAITDRDFTIAAIVGRNTKTEEEEDAEAAEAVEAAEAAESETGEAASG